MDGQSMIAEDDTLLVEAPRLKREGSLIVTDIDLQWLITERTTTTSWAENKKYNPPPYEFITRKFRSGGVITEKLLRRIDALPAVPKEGPGRDERCEEVIGIQKAGLVGRLSFLWRVK
jgi:NAD+ synthase (glutamine-hydrolysing)